MEIRKLQLSDVQAKLSVIMPVFNERFIVESSIERVLSFRDPRIRDIELIIVDDGSDDGTSGILDGIASQRDAIHLIRLAENGGKGNALRVAAAAATGELTVIHDADLEYDPRDWRQMLDPFFETDADAVIGSRFAAARYRRAIYYRHTLGNKLLTTWSNLTTDLYLTDVESCCKMVRTSLLQSIPIRSRGFNVEVELVAKLAKRGAVIYEVPISYAGRTYNEGKKTTARDGFVALGAIARWWFVDDLYQEDQYGATILTSMNKVERFNQWMAEVLSEWVGNRVLEIGAGIGNLTTHLIPRERYLASDLDQAHVDYLRNFALGKPYLEAERIDLLNEDTFTRLAGRFDTVVCLNVLEHVRDDVRAAKNIYRALEPGGRAIVLVPQGQWLFSSLDECVGHVKRYSAEELRSLLEGCGFQIEALQDYNRIGMPGWLINGKLLQRRHFSRLQLKLLNSVTPLVKRIDHLAPWPGLSILAVGRK